VLKFLTIACNGLDYPFIVINSFVFASLTSD